MFWKLLYSWMIALCYLENWLQWNAHFQEGSAGNKCFTEGWRRNAALTRAHFDLCKVGDSRTILLEVCVVNFILRSISDGTLRSYVCCLCIWREISTNSTRGPLSPLNITLIRVSSDGHMLRCRFGNDSFPWHTITIVKAFRTVLAAKLRITKVLLRAIILFWRCGSLSHHCTNKHLSSRLACSLVYDSMIAL